MNSNPELLDEELSMPNFDELTVEEIKEQFMNERQRSNMLEKDLFKKTTQCRRLDV